MSEILPGWPCALLPSSPPSIVDKLSTPTADDILPQLLQLTPRGPAWGTDEAGDGQGAQPVMLSVWRAIAAHVAANYAIDFTLASQCFPSAISYSLPDWEAEYGLPDACHTGPVSTAQRINAVRAKFGAIGGQSPAYFICLAASLGYDISIEEPSQFICDESECVGTGLYEGWFLCDEGVCDETALESFVVGSDPDADDHDNELSEQSCWKFWVVHVGTTSLSWFECDDGECAYDPLEGFAQAVDLECAFRRLCPPHTELVFNYSALTP